VEEPPNSKNPARQASTIRGELTQQKGNSKMKGMKTGPERRGPDSAASCSDGSVAGVGAVWLRPCEPRASGSCARWVVSSPRPSEPTCARGPVSSPRSSERASGSYAGWAVSSPPPPPTPPPPSSPLSPKQMGNRCGGTRVIRGRSCGRR